MKRVRKSGIRVIHRIKDGKLTFEEQPVSQTKRKFPGNPKEKSK